MKNDIVYKLGEDTNFFKEIPREELLILLENSKTVSLNKNDYFLKKGDIPRKIGFVRSGILRLFYIDKTGKEITKHFCPEQTLAISYSAFIKEEPSKFFIQALEKTRLLIIDKNTYDFLLNRNIYWQKAARKLAEIVFILKEKKEAEFLMDDAQTRYIKFIKDYPNLINRIKHHYIASFLGITPESLSRIRAQIK